MDADKRHQLKQNELAEALGRLRDFSNNPRTTYWVVGLAILVGLYAGYRLWGRWQVHQVTEGWAELAQVSSRLNEEEMAPALDDLQSLVANTTDPTLAAYARVRLGTVLRSEARDKPERREQLLDQSIAVLKQVVDDPATPAALVATAAFSLGSSYESRGMFDEAVAAYQQLADEGRFVGSPFKLRASERLEDIDELRVPIHFEPGLPPPPKPPTTLPVQLERITPPTTAPAPAVNVTVPAGAEPAGDETPARPTTQPAATPPGLEPAPPEPDPDTPAADDPSAEPAAEPPTTQPASGRPGDDSP